MINIIKKSKILILIVVIFCFSFILNLGMDKVLAQTQSPQEQSPPSATGFLKGYKEFSQGLVSEEAFKKETKSVPKFIVEIINYVAVILSIIFFVLTLYYGIYYMLSRGESDKIKTAQQGLKYSLIGVIIVILSFSLVHLILGLFQETIPEKSPTSLLETIKYFL